jgi:chromosome segregation ATPase
VAIDTQFPSAERTQLINRIATLETEVRDAKAGWQACYDEADTVRKQRDKLQVDIDGKTTTIISLEGNCNDWRKRDAAWQASYDSSQNTIMVKDLRIQTLEGEVKERDALIAGKDAQILQLTTERHQAVEN